MWKLAGLAIALAGASPAHAQAPALLPLPRSMSQAGDAIALTGQFAPDLARCDTRLAATAAARFQRDVDRLVGGHLGGPPMALRISCRPGAAADRNGQVPEGYRLTSAAGGVEIDADSEVGVLRALASLRQLVRMNDRNPVLAAARIDDAPRFPWRGIMIDTSRHFVSVDTILRQIDAMELTKLNILHLSLSNNEGFRVESRVFPRLTQANQGQFYTQAQIREIVRYAADRGVRIIPEFNMPGHTLAILNAYPELASFPLQPRDATLIARAALNPANEQTYRFVQRLLDEMMPLFPDALIHLGGDEVTAQAWQNDPQIARFRAANNLPTNADLEAYFHRRVRAMVARRGRTVIGWEEMAGRPLAPDVVVEVWRTSNPVSSVTASGNRVIVAAGYYLDLLRSGDEHYGIDPLDPAAYGLITPEALPVLQQSPMGAAFVNEALVARPMAPLTPAQESLVIGGEAPLWAEVVDDEMIDHRLWPRAAAIAERFWSPAAVRDVADMRRRLVPTMTQLRALGLADGANQDRMIARLAPDAPAPVRALIDVVAPVRNYARMQAIYDPRGDRLLNQLADIANSDSLEALRLDMDVRAYVAGGRDRASVLRALFARWRDNDAAYAEIARGRPSLEAALPASRNLARLGRAGLTLLDAIGNGRPLAPPDRQEAEALLEELGRQVDASASLLNVSTQRQPPAAIFFQVLPAMRMLLSAVPASR